MLKTYHGGGLTTRNGYGLFAQCCRHFSWRRLIGSCPGPNLAAIVLPKKQGKTSQYFKKSCCSLFLWYLTPKHKFHHRWSDKLSGVIRTQHRSQFYQPMLPEQGLGSSPDLMFRYLRKINTDQTFFTIHSC